MRIDPQPGNIIVIIASAVLAPVRRPERLPSQSALEVLDRLHRNRVTHLLVETRIGFRWLKAIGREQRWRVQVDRRIGGIAARVDVDNFDILADRTRLEIVFPRNFDRYAAHAGEVIACGERWIERENA